MPEKTQNNNYKKKKSNYNKSYENNSRQSTQTPTNEFSSFYSQQEKSNFYFGFNVFDLYTREQLVNLVKDPMGNNQLLRELSLILYSTNGTYTNTVDYMTAIPTLDRVIVPHGSNLKKRKKNKELMESTLRTIKDQEIIRDALWRGMVEGIAFYYFETTGRPNFLEKMLSDYDVDSIVEINELGINASIISLPADYTKIVGIKNNSYVIAFNLDYFDLSTGEKPEQKLKKFPKEIRDAYNGRRNQDGKFNGGNWVILDNNKTIVHKIRSKREEKYGRPLVLAAINDILYEDYFLSTKRNILDEINNRVVYQVLPEGKDKGTCSLTKKQQEQQHNAVKDGVLRKNNRGGTSFFTVSAGTKLSTLEIGNTNIFDEKYESKLGDKIALGMGIASSLLNGSSSGSYSSQENNLELLTSQLFMWIGQISAELNKCISANTINDKKNWVECKYLKITYVNKKNMVGYAKDLYLQGCGSLSLWVASCGIDPEAFFALLDDEIENGIYEKYKPHQTSFTLSGDDKEAGRPETDNPSASTEQTRKNNGNSLPSPSDKK